MRLRTEHRPRSPWPTSPPRMSGPSRSAHKCCSERRRKYPGAQVKERPARREKERERTCPGEWVVRTKLQLSTMHRTEPLSGRPLLRLRLCDGGGGGGLMREAKVETAEAAAAATEVEAEVEAEEGEEEVSTSEGSEQAPHSHHHRSHLLTFRRLFDEAQINRKSRKPSQANIWPSRDRFQVSRWRSGSR